MKKTKKIKIFGIIVILSSMISFFSCDDEIKVTYILPGAGYIARNISLTAPNGGESWVIGRNNYSITWTAEYITGPVDIELCQKEVPTCDDTAETCSYSFLLHIDRHVANSGSYTWSTSLAEESLTSVITTGNYYKIKVRDVFTPIIVDISDESFSLTQPITITSPNGEETITIGTTHDITWTAIADITSVNIQLWQTATNSEGDPVNIQVGDDIALDVASSSGGTYTWDTTGLTAGTTYFLKIVDKEYPKLTDASNQYFTLSQ